MRAADDGAPKAPPLIEQFVRQLVIANKAVALYPPSSAIPRDTSEEAIAALSKALAEQPEVRLVVGKRGLYYDSAPIYPTQPAFASFAHELYLRKLADVSFHVGAEPRELIAFLSILNLTPDEVTAGGGFEARLWEQGVSAISVAEAQVTLVEAESGALPTSSEEAPVPVAEPVQKSRSEIDEALASAYGGRPRDQLVIARVIGEPRAVREYLQETLISGVGGFDLQLAGERFSELAEIAYEMGGEERQALLRSLADALRSLDANLQHDLIVGEVLPEARTSEALAEVIRELGLDDVCRIIVGRLADTDVSRDALVRAVRNLALVSMADRQEVLESASAAMLGAGFDEKLVADVLEGAAPSRLMVRGMPGPLRGVRPVDAVLQLLALAPSAPAPLDEQVEGLADLRDEARVGVTDGDVISTFVSLVSMDTRETQFASIMSMLEDALSLLVDRGEYDVAADAASQLREAADNPEFSVEQRTRLRHAIGRFSRPGDVRALAKTLQLYPPGTPEHEAARRLLDTLGPLAIQPLLEQLADEQSMITRKALVDLLSEIAGQYVQELSAYVSDPRWYFVRNVVTILGSTKSSTALPYLERTLRHSDARVRRETIRGLLGNNDRLATEMLVVALSDEDANNVQLAARYLGSRAARGAIPTLEMVARGEGRGSRDNGPRVEAIVALGRLGAVEALPTLETLAGKRRTLLRGAKTRELRSAAESAILAIRLKGATG